MILDSQDLMKSLVFVNFHFVQFFALKIFGKLYCPMIDVPLNIHVYKVIIIIVYKDFFFKILLN